MQPVTIYGIKCSKKDEELLMRRVNGLLATHNRTTSKGTDPSMLKAYEPLKIKYFYWNLNKATGTWFDIYPNEGLDGTWFFPDRRDYGWLMHVRIDTARFPASTKEKAETFIQQVLQAVEFPYVVIRESTDLLAGLPRGLHDRPSEK